MSAMMHMFSENGLSFECDDEEPTIWIRSYRTRDTVSLDMIGADDRAALRAALDAADTIACKGDTK